MRCSTGLLLIIMSREPGRRSFGYCTTLFSTTTRRWKSACLSFLPLRRPSSYVGMYVPMYIIMHAYTYNVIIVYERCNELRLMFEPNRTLDSECSGVRSLIFVPNSPSVESSRYVGRRVRKSNGSLHRRSILRVNTFGRIYRGCASHSVHVLPVLYSGLLRRSGTIILYRYMTPKGKVRETCRLCRRPYADFIVFTSKPIRVLPIFLHSLRKLVTIIRYYLHIINYYYFLLFERNYSGRRRHKIPGDTPSPPFYSGAHQHGISESFLARKRVSEFHKYMSISELYYIKD